MNYLFNSLIYVYQKYIVYILIAQWKTYCVSL